MFSYSDNGKLLGLLKVIWCLIVTMVNCWVCSRSMLSYSDKDKLFATAQGQCCLIVTMINFCLFKVNSVS